MKLLESESIDEILRKIDIKRDKENFMIFAVFWHFLLDF